MEEARRFLCFIFPGTGSLLFVGVYVWLSYPELFTSFPIEGAEGIVSAVALVLASGGLAYTLSLLQHLAYNSLPVYERLGFVVDLRGALERGVTDRKLILRPGEDGEDLSTPLPLTQPEAWVVKTIVWHTHVEKGVRQAAQPRVRSLWDILHASAAMFVGSLLWLLVWIAFSVRCGVTSWSGFAVAAVLGILVSCGMALNLKRAASTASEVTQGVLATFLENSSKAIVVPCYFLASKESQGGPGGTGGSSAGASRAG